MKNKNKTIYAFIDAQNLNLGTSKDIYRGEGKNKKIIYKGWPLDFGKFRKYLNDKFRVTKAFLFIGYIPQHQSLYNYLQQQGYEIIFKPTVKDGQGKVKGNVDAELVLHSAKIEYDNYDKAVIVAGDGDYYCLHDFLTKNNKLLKIIIPNSKSESSLLKPFQSFKIFIEHEESKLKR